jgi:site-specific DNA-methyltransferase (adenine-specific)|tara:strand:- start:10271 stop:10855 length:585 start_codon:yes stop_codon:yes gene_type:complete
MKKYKIIYADPPWKYSSKQLYGDKKSGFDDNGKRKRFSKLEKIYSTMELNDIKLLPIQDIICKDSAYFMWVTDSHLKEGIEVLKNWGFKYKTIAFVWLKKYRTGTTVYNFAPWTLKSTEICLLGTKGQMSKYKICNNIKQLVIAERTTHSKKPHEVRKRIECLFGELPRIELFAREKTKGWDTWGNEVKNDIEL